MIYKWIKTFQIRVNDLLNSDKLKFITEIWNPTEAETSTTTIDETISIVNSPVFAFLDIKLFWH